MFRLLGKLAIVLAAMSWLAGATLFVVGSYLVTWPLMRKSPRERRLRASMDLAAAAMQLVQVLQSSAESLVSTEVERAEQ